MFLAELHARRFVVLGHDFWGDFAVIFFSKYGIAVFRVQVCGNFKFYEVVIGEKLSSGDLLHFFEA